MFKYISTALLVIGLCIGLSAIAQDQEIQAGPHPKIVFPEQSFDFGYAPEGFFLIHPFVVRNEGDGDLIIERVRTTCGCTNAPLKKSELAPGEETEVTVIFNSTRYNRRVSLGTIVSSNDPINRSIRATFTANMDHTGFLFNVEPFGLEIEKGKSPPKKMTFTVENNSENDYELKLVQWTLDVLEEPNIKDNKLKAGKKTTIEVSIRDDYDYSEEYIKSSFTIEAEGAESQFRFTIPVKGAGPK
ncbi:MAG TPA: DUF1573 domain-containing protein [candidate division Zixibacteria bacterium]|nr:DUF1573 domain-containing protein [candidate division Zixibacteria bacterium]